MKRLTALGKYLRYESFHIRLILRLTYEHLNGVNYDVKYIPHWIVTGQMERHHVVR